MTTEHTFNLNLGTKDADIPDWVPENWVEEIARRIDLLSSEDRETISGAIALGWGLTIPLGENENGITLVSADEKERVFVTPGRRLRKDRTRRLLVRHATDAGLEAMRASDGDIYTVFELNPLHPINVNLIRPAEPKPKPVRKEAPVTQRKLKKHIVSTRPMLAKSRKDRGYESKIAIERTWSDGSTDYKCAACEYTNDNRLGIRGHWQKHVRKGEVEAVGAPKTRDTFLAEVPNAAVYKPRQTRVDALAAMLADLLANGEIDPDALALAALTWVHEQTKHGTTHAAEIEDMSDSDILQRIRMLLYPEQNKEIELLQAEVLALREELNAQHVEFDSMRAELGAAISDRDTYKERAARAISDLRGLRDLVSSIKDEDYPEEEEK